MAQRRDRVARGVEIGSTAVAGSVGSVLGAAKLRDAYKKDYPRRFAQHASHAEHAASTVAPRAGRLARLVSHGDPGGFIPLATFTAAAGTATGVSRYRKHREKLLAKASSEERKVPVAGYVKGIGRVRILHYQGNGHFMVLDRRDTRRVVHRNLIRFAKAASGQEPAVLRDAQDLDVRVRRAKRKALPSGLQLAARAGDRTRIAIANEQERLAKAAHDPDRSVRRKERAASGMLGGGAVAAGVGSFRAVNAGRGHLRAASTSAAARDTSFAHGHRGMNEHMDHLEANVKAKKQRKAVPIGDLEHSVHGAQYVRTKYVAGAAHHGQAVRSAHEATAAFRRARNLRVAATGLAGGAWLAHRRASGHDR